MPFNETPSPNIKPSIIASLRDTELTNSHSVSFLTSDPIRELLDTITTDSVELEVITLDTSLGFPKLDIQLSKQFQAYVY